MEIELADFVDNVYGYMFLELIQENKLEEAATCLATKIQPLSRALPVAGREEIRKMKTLLLKGQKLLRRRCPDAANARVHVAVRDEDPFTQILSSLLVCLLCLCRPQLLTARAHGENTAGEDHAHGAKQCTASEQSPRTPVAPKLVLPAGCFAVPLHTVDQVEPGRGHGPGHIKAPALARGDHLPL